MTSTSADPASVVASGPVPARRRPVLMIVHAYYDEDPRVRREAEALVVAGRPVLVLGLRRPGEPPTATVDGVRVERLDVQRHQGAGLGIYLREYLSFLWRSGRAAVRAHRREGFALVQVHSLPDFLVFAALPLKLSGVPVVLDLHEAMPDFFRSRFARAANPVAHRLLLIQERLSIALSNATLTVNEALGERLVRRGIKLAKVTVVPNSPALARFDPSAHPVRPFAADGTVRLVYTGALTPVYELDVALRALASIVASQPGLDVRFEVYGRGDREPALRALADELRLAGRVTFHGRIPIEAVPAAVAATDIGLAPTRRDAFTDMSLSTKIFEYAAMGKPVVASRLPMVERTFPAGTVATYEPGDAAALAAAVLRLVDDDAARAAAVAGTAALVREAGWERHAPDYIALIDRLARPDERA